MAVWHSTNPSCPGPHSKPPVWHSTRRSWPARRYPPPVNTPAASRRSAAVFRRKRLWHSTRRSQDWCRRPAVCLCCRRGGPAGRGMPLSESKPFTAVRSPPSNARYDGIALNASTSVKAASRAFSFTSRSAAVPAQGSVAATAMHAAHAIDVAELEIFAHTVVTSFGCGAQPLACLSFAGTWSPCPSMSNLP